MVVVTDYLMSEYGETLQAAGCILGALVIFALVRWTNFRDRSRAVKAPAPDSDDPPESN